MKLRDIPTSSVPSLVTVGTFDGLHRGHRLLLDFMREKAEENHLKPIAVTFDRHPLEVIAPERAPLVLSSPEEKSAMIAQMGVTPVTVTFDRDLSSMTAEEWIARMVSDFGARMMVIGYDNSFGSDGRSMTPADYAEAGRRHGVEVIMAPCLPGVSSSLVRKAIMKGDMKAAADMIGRSYSVPGTVVEGDHIGRTLGFPTANIATPQRRLLPPPGVYAATVTISDDRTLSAVVNIGLRPTVTDSGEMRVEAHVIGYEGNLYGTELKISFISRLRDEQKFGSLMQLKEAIESDKKQVEGMNLV